MTTSASRYLLGALKQNAYIYVDTTTGKEAVLVKRLVAKPRTRHFREGVVVDAAFILHELAGVRVGKGVKVALPVFLAESLAFLGIFRRPVASDGRSAVTSSYLNAGIGSASHITADTFQAILHFHCARSLQIAVPAGFVEGEENALFVLPAFGRTLGYVIGFQLPDVSFYVVFAVLDAGSTRKVVAVRKS